MGKQSFHYGISIIRDRGIDAAALDFIESRHGTGGIVFVDGWTGKGAITGELSRTLKDRPGYPEQPRLVVLADPCGCALGLLPVTMTGLSRSVSWARLFRV